VTFTHLMPATVRGFDPTDPPDPIDPYDLPDPLDLPDPIDPLDPRSTRRPTDQDWT